MSILSNQGLEKV